MFNTTKEEAYQAWLLDRNMGRFSLVGLGPLVRDQKDGMVYDVVEFLRRYFDEEKARNR